MCLLINSGWTPPAQESTDCISPNEQLLQVLLEMHKDSVITKALRPNNSFSPGSRPGMSVLRNLLAAISFLSFKWAAQSIGCSKDETFSNGKTHLYSSAYHQLTSSWVTLSKTLSFSESILQVSKVRIHWNAFHIVYWKDWVRYLEKQRYNA